MISTEPDLYVSIDQAIIANTTNSRGDNNQLRQNFSYPFSLFILTNIY